MHRVDREGVLAARPCQLERFFELSNTRSGAARRALASPALEQHSRPGATERLGVVEQRVALLEAAAQALDPRELRQHLGASGVRRLLPELRTETRLGGVEVAEVPQRP